MAITEKCFFFDGNMLTGTLRRTQTYGQYSQMKLFKGYLVLIQSLGIMIEVHKNNTRTMNMIWMCVSRGPMVLLTLTWSVCGYMYLVVAKYIYYNNVHALKRNVTYKSTGCDVKRSII